MENLLEAWREFLRGKRRRRHAFKINDPKPRHIHKASVRDRLLHHALYRILYPYFDQKFIFDSFSCRRDKGTHLALNRFRDYSRIVSKNHTRTVWILKCDVRKFFENIDHEILKKILAQHIFDSDMLWLRGVSSKPCGVGQAVFPFFFLIFFVAAAKIFPPPVSRSERNFPKSEIFDKISSSGIIRILNVNLDYHL